MWIEIRGAFYNLDNITSIEKFGKNAIALDDTIVAVDDSDTALEYIREALCNSTRIG